VQLRSESPGRRRVWSRTSTLALHKFGALHPDSTVNEGDGDFATPTRQSHQGSQSYQHQGDVCHLLEKCVFLPSGPKILNSSALGDYREIQSRM
jgi:hypothetical protein